MKLLPTTNLTTALLLSDKVAADLQIWKIETTIRSRKAIFCIVKDDGPYSLYLWSPSAARLGGADSLEDLVTMFNSYLDNARPPRPVLELAHVRA